MENFEEILSKYEVIKKDKKPKLLLKMSKKL